MEENCFKKVIDQQKAYFLTGKTLSYDFRLQQLTLLKSMIKQHQNEIIDALRQDLHKPETEAIFNEILIVLNEITFAIKNLKKWMKPAKVRTPFPLLWPGRSHIYSEPYGLVLIISPWNYPFLLAILPLIGAISAGNCVLLKPSEISSYTENLLITLINKYFAMKYIAAIKADKGMTLQLLQEKWDYIFFTGGTQVGKLVMESAAKHLTPVTLELGGKSPCIIDQTADLSFAAKRIIWSKYINVGQTCIAPDYLFVHHKIKDDLISLLIKTIEQFYGDNPQLSQSYGRIINKKQFERINKLINPLHVIYGGKINEEDLYIAPTLLDGVSWDDPIMQEEIFGPLLPIITYSNIEDVITICKKKPKPLSLYLFTRDYNSEKLIMHNLSFGGGCINDCVLHIINPYLPFGGIGESGLGCYHGKYSFKTFSHHKSIYRKSFLVDFNLQYPPYSNNKIKWLKRLLFKSYFKSY